MRKLIALLVVGFQFQFGFSQINEVENLIIQDTIVAPIPVIIDASYKGGVNNFYNYISTNFNYNNLEKTDVIEEFKGRDIMTIYLSFFINEEGKPVDFKPLNTTEENSFYKEATRVIGSTKWIPATQDSVIIKQEFRIPIQAYISDFAE